jgi:GABA permease
MNFVVLAAVLSCLNSGLYTCSRMLFTLARHGDASSVVVSLNKRQVPVNALLACAAVAFLCIAMDYFSPDTVFLFLLNTSGATVLLAYLMIALSQIKLRRQFEREAPERLKLKMWLFPGLSIATAGAIVALLIAMVVMESNRTQILMSLLAGAIIAGAYLLRRKHGPKAPEPLPEREAAFVD